MFNTLAYSKELEQAGFSRDQAEATINVFFKFMEYNFATKTDIAEANDNTKSSLTQMNSSVNSEMGRLRVELKTEINELRTELKTEINELRIEIKAEINELRTEIRAEVTKLRSEISDIRYQIATFENKMIIKFGLMQAATIGILAAIIKLL